MYIYILSLVNDINAITLSCSVIKGKYGQINMVILMWLCVSDGLIGMGKYCKIWPNKSKYGKKEGFKTI